MIIGLFLKFTSIKKRGDFYIILFFSFVMYKLKKFVNIDIIKYFKYILIFIALLSLSEYNFWNIYLTLTL